MGLLHNAWHTFSVGILVVIDGPTFTDQEAMNLTNPKADRQAPESGIEVEVVATVVRVSDLDRSLNFYSDVFECRLVVREADMALLLTPKGFELYLHQQDELHSRRHPDALGVHYLMWATDSRSDLERITDRLRAYDSAVYSHTIEGIRVLEGKDPDGCRVLVAYPTPRRLPRTAIAVRFRG